MKASNSFSDEEIITALGGANQDQHSRVLRTLYQSNFPKVLSFVKSNSGSDEQAQDIFQDAMVILFRKINSQEFKKASSINTFLFGIARNLWLQALSKNKRHQAFTHEVKVTSSEGYEQVDDSGTPNRKILDTVMSELNEKCRDLLVSYYYANLSIREIQEELILGSEQATRNKIYRCMQRLRNICEENNLTIDNFSFDEK